MERGEGGRGEDQFPFGFLAQYSGFGLTLALATGFFFAIGWWLDGKTGKSPVFLVIFFLLGSAAGFLSVYRAFGNDGGKPK